MNFKQKVLLCFLVVAMIFQEASAQKQQEFGVRFNDSDRLTAIYKQQKGANTFTRYRLGFSNVRLLKAGDNQRLQVDVQLAFGEENRKDLSDDFQFIHGIEPALGIAFAKQNGNGRTVLSPSIGYILGVQYNLNPNVALAVEIVPSLSGRFQADSNWRENMVLDFGVGFEATALTFLYRFE